MKYLIVFFISLSLFAAPRTYQPIAEVPMELSLLIKSIQARPQSEEEKKKFLELLTKLDYLLPQMTKEEAFFLSKSEIYFDILRRNRNNNKVDLKLLELSSLKELKDRLEINQLLYSPYTQWLGNALLKDLSNLFESTLFSIYKGLKKDDLALRSSSLRIYEKKLLMLLPWYQKFVDSLPSELEMMVKDLELKQLESIVHTAERLIRFSRFKKLDPLPKDYTLKAFGLKEEVVEEESQEVENVVENLNIPETIEEESKNAENWVPKDLFPQPDPNYKAPDQLPEPTDDWSEEL